jgi:death-on-curing protein
MSSLEPLFLTREQIERLHDLSLERFGGAVGIHDEGLIDSAMAAAKNTFFYGYGDLFDIAAAYAFHLSQAQGFRDGNKRTGIGAALIFLELNGIKGVPDDDTLYDGLIAVAEKRLDKAGLTALLREAATHGS